MRADLIKEYHSTPAGGHSGLKPTLARLAASFYWPGLYTDTKAFIHTCVVCQQNKYVPAKKYGLLQLLQAPKQVWEDLTMDFVTHLPVSLGHTAIWVICDRLSKYVHFIALPTKYSAQDLAARFSVEVYRLHGAPRSIISDRDPLFLSSFWKEFFHLQGTTLNFSTAYHSETNGQTEVVNRSLEAYLRCFASENPKHWFHFLHLAEFWHNTCFHSSIGMTPFEALYGRPPPTLQDFLPGSTAVDSIATTLYTE